MYVTNVHASSCIFSPYFFKILAQKGLRAKFFPQTNPANGVLPQVPQKRRSIQSFGPKMQWMDLGTVRTCTCVASGEKGRAFVRSSWSRSRCTDRPIFSWVFVGYWADLDGSWRSLAKWCKMTWPSATPKLQGYGSERFPVVLGSDPVIQWYRIFSIYLSISIYIYIGWWRDVLKWKIPEYHSTWVSFFMEKISAPDMEISIPWMVTWWTEDIPNRSGSWVAGANCLVRSADSKPSKSRMPWWVDGEASGLRFTWWNIQVEVEVLPVQHGETLRIHREVQGWRDEFIKK